MPPVSLVPEAEVEIRHSILDYKKSQQRRKVLLGLYRLGTGTLAQLAKNLHNSVPSVTSIVEELIEEGWVTASGPATATGNFGRPPVLFGLNVRRNFVVVLDISTHDTKVLLLNPRQEVIVRRDFDLRLEDNPAFVDGLMEFTGRVLDESGLERDDLLAIGVAIPGLVHARNGLNYTYKSINHADESLGHWLSEQVGLPVFLINDTKATALGEQRCGLAQGKKHVLSINIDWGVGLGIILNGEVFQGASGFAGELGHIQVVPNGERCHCGKTGCLDTITSASSLIRRVRRGLEEGRVSKLAVYPVDEVDLEMVIEATHQGDAFALEVLHEVGTELGKGLAIAIQLLNPEMIIIDGIMAKAGAFITDPLERAIGEYCLSDFRNDLTVEISQLGERAKWLGTHAFVMENVFATLS